MANARDFDRLAELERSGQAFALATVVGRRAPVSATLGDRAIVFADGRMEGYVGGACARDIVLTWALGALRRGRSQLLSIRPGFATERAAGEDGIDRVVVPMGCASEGAIEIYIEPHLPRRRLIVVGFTPVAEAVARVGASLDYRVTRFVLAKEVAQLKAEPEVEIFALDELGSFLEREGSDAARIAAVVASQGHYDESALERLLAIPLGYLGVLASRKRMDALRGSLTQSGVGLERLLQIRNPIGLDIGAQGRLRSRSRSWPRSSRSRRARRRSRKTLPRQPDPRRSSTRSAACGSSRAVSHRSSSTRASRTTFAATAACAVLHPNRSAIWPRSNGHDRR